MKCQILPHSAIAVNLISLETLSMLHPSFFKRLMFEKSHILYMSNIHPCPPPSRNSLWKEGPFLLYSHLWTELTTEKWLREPDSNLVYKALCFLWANNHSFNVTTWSLPSFPLFKVMIIVMASHQVFLGN